MEKLEALKQTEKKKIIVTGTSGFIGRRVANQLQLLGHDVYGVERYVAGRTVYGLKSFKTVFADLNDHFAVKQVIKSVKPDAVFHIAALSAVAYSYNHPVDVNETNYLATAHLAEACMRENCVEHFLFAGTSEEYGNQAKFPIPETADLKPNSPYSASKVAADKYLNYMIETYGFPATILRPFNSYGRTDDTHFLTESIIHQMLMGDVVNLGMREPIRDLMYMSDHVNAYITCFQNPHVSIGETFNFCTGKGWSIPELVNKIAGILDWKGTVNYDTIPVRPNDILTLIGDNSKAKRLLNWVPHVSLDEGLKIVISNLQEKNKKECLPIVVQH
jgi:nucleoside-diphosphate-sugar epimerase